MRFWQQILFLWQKDLYWLFQIKSFCKIIFGSVELENKIIDSLFCYFSFCFLFSCLLSVFYRKKWLSYLSHVISPYLHGKLIKWTSAFYLILFCLVLPKILNMLIFMNRVISIICICQLYFMLFLMFKNVYSSKYFDYE